jgi:kynurenine formamidase
MTARGRMIDVSHTATRRARISPRSRLGLTEADVRGRAVLVNTGWDRHWGSERYFEGHPYLTGELAEWLVRAGAVLVGIDSLNIDGIATRERPVRSVLLGHEVPSRSSTTSPGSRPCPIAAAASSPSR